MKNFFIILITKILIFIIKILGKTGGNFPGRFATNLNKDILKYFKINCPVIAVAGTNGKTTTNNCIYEILKNAKYKKVVSNFQGNNMDTGIVSVLLKNCTLTGKVKADYITLEVDENYIPFVFSQIRLDTLVILNFFRDQLDRVGEIETIISNINEFLKTYNGNLILNSDDPNVSRLGTANKDNKNVYYFSVEKYQYATQSMQEVGEGKFCPFCSTRLEYEYYQYAHIGRFKCANCEYGNNPIYKLVTDVNLENKTFKIDNDLFKIKYNSIYSVYNFLAAITVASIQGISIEIIKKVIEKFELNNGRQEKIIINNCETVINLAKNPTGVNVSLRLVNEDTESKDILFVLNDNLADGKDVSWIYDINFTELKNVKRIITSGTRAYDMAICIKNNGIPVEKIEVYIDLQEAVNALYSTKSKKYAISNYTAIQDTRNAIINFGQGDA